MSPPKPFDQLEGLDAFRFFFKLCTQCVSLEVFCLFVFELKIPAPFGALRLSTSETSSSKEP